MKKSIRFNVAFVIIAIVVMVIIQSLVAVTRQIATIPYSQFQELLQQGKVAAVTTDEAILAGMLAKAPNRSQFEIPNVQISSEPYGLGMRKDDAKFIAFVDRTVLEMEKSGEAKRIFDRWFGPGSAFHLQRNFRIVADK